ncbi:YicC/YloC family endoribonuclease [Alkalibacter mobilis]|uniref:YicC/YloC family endoribonuclease n=1 Tax=Alkalibacter mobilis TaxID=2787712 RepID=UPI0018A0F6F7|nr:YicC/YloC family endoribonuclease [Alkalibacter mobilis]MBF7095863.1 YicC family protein [Alkalibacter mobilis]
MNSMTGYGKGEFKDDLIDITVEIKTINHRYKDFFIRMPRQLNFAEDMIRKEVGKFLVRGRIEINVKINHFGLESKNIKVDLDLAKAYMDCLKTIKNQIPEVTGEYSLSLISKFPDVIYSEETETDMEILWRKVKAALGKALDGVVETRKSEGAALESDFVKRLGLIENDLKQIKSLEDVVLKDNTEKLRMRIQEYTQEIEIDEKRLLEEIAYLSDKANITEELIRLNSHIQRFGKIMNESDSVGRKLDFLIQEMHREINTIGSKSNHLDISNFVVDIKSEIEKMREQIQNIE